MTKLKLTPCLLIDTPKEKISMCAFWRTPEIEGQMNSGYLIEIANHETGHFYSGECLDDDHVWRELKAKGYDKPTRKFIIKHC